MKSILLLFFLFLSKFYEMSEWSITCLNVASIIRFTSSPSHFDALTKCWIFNKFNFVLVLVVRVYTYKGLSKCCCYAQITQTFHLYAIQWNTHRNNTVLRAYCVKKKKHWKGRRKMTNLTDEKKQRSSHRRIKKLYKYFNDDKD